MLALADYYRTVEPGWAPATGTAPRNHWRRNRKEQATGERIGLSCFGSAQRLVGQFNDVVADYSVRTLAGGMERANRNIDELLTKLHGTFHRLLQSRIDEEMFDVISGFEALAGPSS